MKTARFSGRKVHIQVLCKGMVTAVHSRAVSSKNLCRCSRQLPLFSGVLLSYSSTSVEGHSTGWKLHGVRGQEYEPPKDIHCQGASGGCPVPQPLQLLQATGGSWGFTRVCYARELLWLNHLQEETVKLGGKLSRISKNVVFSIIWYHNLHILAPPPPFCTHPG